MHARFVCKFLVVFLSSFVLLLSGTAYADGDHDDDSDAVKYRHAVMASMGDHFAAIVMVFTGRIDKPNDLLIHAEALAQTASTVGGLFDPGTEGGDALPIIWDEPDEVAAAAKDLAATTTALAEAVASGDRGAIAKAFKAAGGSCKGCHEQYREEDD